MSVAPAFNKINHTKFCKRCIAGLPPSALEADSARVVVGFYCLGAMDLLGSLDQSEESDREEWREWIWSQQTSSSDSKDRLGGFRPGPYMYIDGYETTPENSGLSINPPHLVVTYAALLSLAILRDNFSRLDRPGILNLLRATQLEDGSFTAIPGQGEADMRMVYTAFAISSMLDDWSGFDVEKAVSFIKSCMIYEGGFGQARYNEAQGGPTYCALASLHLVPDHYKQQAQLTPVQRSRLIRWLAHNQHKGGGFSGRTEKPADACYSFWCGASLQILGAASLVNSSSNAAFLYNCQFKYGGIAKAPDEHPDPYHAYLALAALAMYPLNALESQQENNTTPESATPRMRTLAPLNPLLNATPETVQWIRGHVPAAKSG